MIMRYNDDCHQEWGHSDSGKVWLIWMFDPAALLDAEEFLSQYYFIPFPIYRACEGDKLSKERATSYQRNSGKGETLCL